MMFGCMTCVCLLVCVYCLFAGVAVVVYVFSWSFVLSLSLSVSVLWVCCVCPIKTIKKAYISNINKLELLHVEIILATVLSNGSSWRMKTGKGGDWRSDLDVFADGRVNVCGMVLGKVYFIILCFPWSALYHHYYCVHCDVFNWKSMIQSQIYFTG